MPRRSIAIAALVAALAALTLSPAAESAGSLAHRVATAMRLAKQADHRADLALKRTAPAGAAGRDGANGSNGADGKPGASIIGAQGVKGDVGSAGAQGDQGPAGEDASPHPAPVSNVNQDTVSLDPANRTTVATVQTFFAQQAPAILLADVELRPLSSGEVTCSLRLNGSTVEERTQTLGVTGVYTLSFHTETDVPSGAGEVDVACSGPARVGGLGARVTVLAA